MNFTYHIKKTSYANGGEKFGIYMVPEGCYRDKQNILYAERDTIQQARNVVAYMNGKNVVKTEWVE